MPAGTRSLRFGETLIAPPALPPPPTRHALLAFLITLAAILQIGTVGWMEIENGAEGFHASTAREMWRTESWRTPEPPLSYWLTLVSFEFLGASATAARLPVALATVASVALTFLIAERFGDYWRGFVAGLIHLCALGSFIWARLVTPEPLFAACLGAIFFCAITGYQRPQTRPFWFAGVAAGMAFACLTRGVAGLLLPAAVFALLAIFFREARMRFQLLLHWSNVVIFLAVILFSLGWNGFALSNFWPRDLAHEVSPWRFFSGHLVWWFPASLLVLPGCLLAGRKIFRPHDFEFALAFPLCWLAVGFAPWLFFGWRQDFAALGGWSAWAIFAATAWERTPPALRLAGLGLTTLAGAALAGVAVCDFTASLPALPSAWLGLRTVLALAGILIALVSLIAAYFSWRNREMLALAILLLGMVPVGLSAAEGMARFGSYLSLANVAHFLQPRVGETGEVFFEGPALAGSSLNFYLERAPIFVKSETAEQSVIDALSAPHPVFLIIPHRRVPFWQERLTDRFHLYHQVTTCGGYVVVSNQP
ncbi:MAG: ArnT family glycosyltransferase [Chthoniobacterales bacterium]